jgi:glucan 1,3-beta-glucosidase
MKFTILSLLGAAQAAANAMVGTNIGGWMVLEPWITPSLFYRFLDKTHTEGIGLDSYTFCEALGPVEGNRVMRAHWDAWFTSEHVRQLAEREVEIIRIPIGDWTTTAYGPYVGCMDGASEKIEWAMDEFHKYGIKVLLDVHAVKDSQNGYDNSGQALNLEWVDETHFKHWSVHNAAWMGHFDGTGYDEINTDNINWAIDNVRALMEKWAKHPALYAVETVNEPW